VIQSGEGGAVEAAQIDDPDPTRGKARTIGHTLFPSTGPSSITGVHFKVDAIYDPPTHGPLGSIEYSEFSRLLIGANQGQATGPAIRQPPGPGGDVFVFDRSDRFFTPSVTWLQDFAHSIVADDFGLRQGTQPHPDFAQPFQLGFYRASSNPTAFGGGTNLAAIDDWSVKLIPPCVTLADCDDGDACTTKECTAGVCRFTDIACDDTDPCTTDTCSAGACMNSPLDCSDGQDCTLDVCTAGFCQYALLVDFATVEAKIPDLFLILDGPACTGDAITKKTARKIKKKVNKVRARIGQADDATKQTALVALLGKADALLGLGQTLIANAAERWRVSPECAAELQAFLAEMRQCVSRLPRG
jgi:hypothetical protein